MELTKLYKCLSDEQRLRILKLLEVGPLCVCHLQDILGESQVKTSKQLLYMKKQGLLSSSRKGTWMIYRISEPIHPMLKATLTHLNSQSKELAVFHKDLKKRAQIVDRMRKKCCTPSDIINTISCH